MQPGVLALAPSNAQPSFSRLFCTVEPAPLQPGLLMDACKYLESLQYRVWKKMLGSVESGKDMQQMLQADGGHPVLQRPGQASQLFSLQPFLGGAKGLPALTHLRKANSPFCLHNSNIRDERSNSRPPLPKSL